jgi:hypothetical protein
MAASERSALTLLEGSMRTFGCCCWLVLILGASYASPSHHSATLFVVSSEMEEVTVPSGAVGAGSTGITTPGPGPSLPGSVSPGEGGSAGQHRASDPEVTTVTKVKSTTVRAYVTTVTGEMFDISMVCYRTYGSCPQPTAGTTYAAELNDDPKYLADYGKRKAFGLMAVKFSPDGKKKVSFEITHAMKAGSTQTRPD